MTLLDIYLNFPINIFRLLILIYSNSWRTGGTVLEADLQSSISVNY